MAGAEGQTDLTWPAGAPGAAAPVRAGQPAPFTRFALDYAARHPDRTLTILQAGCATAGPELDLATLRVAGHEVAVTRIDDDSQAVRAVVARNPDLRSAILGDLRSLPLQPRSYDIVQCSMLLTRIHHAELVLDRLVAALRPDGLLMLRTAVRDTAAGFVDRRLPRFLRTAAWQTVRPGEPGPFAAVYEPIASARGIQAFLLRHGLVPAHRQYRRAGADGPPFVLAAARLAARLSRGRLPADHDELVYIVRKPADPFARVLQ